ncbi:MAG TPA: RNA methyltransferase [Vicinamibacterales bacterium]|jgi:tRNA G18 (ribose-2'-O)-methylase SpoU
MPFDRIDSADDPRVADYRGVSEPELLRSRDLFVAEGRMVVTRLIEDGRWILRSVLVSAAARQDLEQTLAVVAARVPIFVCEAADFLGITGHDIHRGCLALVERPPALPLEAALTGARLVVVLEGVSNADNVGGVFRNAAAFGADVVMLGPTCCDPLYRKAIRTSMGAILRVPFVQLREWPAALPRLRAAGFRLVALTPREPSEPLDTFASRPRAAKLALLVGAEGQGLTPAIESAADDRVRIPMARGVDSLNLAVATGIALEHLTRGTFGTA